MIWLISCLVVVVASLFYIFYLPEKLFVGRQKTRVEYLRERKEAVYENLRDLNFEYKAGKVSDVDYQTLQSSLQDEAAAVLAEISSLEKNSAGAGAPAGSNLPKRKRKSHRLGARSLGS